MNQPPRRPSTLRSFSAILRKQRIVATVDHVLGRNESRTNGLTQKPL